MCIRDSQLWRPNEGCTSLRSAELCSKVLQILKIFFVRLSRGTQVHRRLMQLWRHSPSIKVLSRGHFRTQHRCGITCSSLLFSDNFFFGCSSSQRNNNSTKERPLSLPLLDSFCFQDLCKLVKMPEANSDLICLAWIINSHLSFGIHKGHLNSRKKIVIPRKTSF